MIIDGHAHAAGDFLHPESIVRVLNASQVDQVVLVPGERQSTRNYSMPNLARLFPDRDVIPFFNALSRNVVSWSGSAKHLYEENHYVHSLVQACPGRVIQFYWVYFQRPDILQEIEQHYREWHFKGLKFHQCWDSFTVRSSLFEAVVEFAVEKALPIFFHVGSTQEVAALITFIRQHPRARFIIAHLFGLERYIESGLNFENVYFEISAPWGISLKRLNKAIAHFGARRIILGSDTPYGKDNLRLNVQRIKDLSISEQDKQLILGKNLQTILGC